MTETIVVYNSFHRINVHERDWRTKYDTIDCFVSLVNVSNESKIVPHIWQRQTKFLRSALCVCVCVCTVEKFLILNRCECQVVFSSGNSAACERRQCRWDEPLRRGTKSNEQKKSSKNFWNMRTIFIYHKRISVIRRLSGNMSYRVMNLMHAIMAFGLKLEPDSLSDEKRLCFRRGSFILHTLCLIHNVHSLPQLVVVWMVQLTYVCEWQ